MCIEYDEKRNFVILSLVGAKEKVDVSSTLRVTTKAFHVVPNRCSWLSRNVMYMWVVVC